MKISKTVKESTPQEEKQEQTRGERVGEHDPVTSAGAYYQPILFLTFPRKLFEERTASLYLEDRTSLAFQPNQWLLDPVIGFRHSPFVVCVADVTPF
ncbi:hypothetical protein TNCV_2469501 [Trichonephila clavipes]|nr:hypothetical protein TNCV_2469501 [Trichonephila clavipes]